MTSLFSLQLGYASTNHPLVTVSYHPFLNFVITDPFLHYECFLACRPPFKLKEPSTEQKVEGLNGVVAFTVNG